MLGLKLLPLSEVQILAAIAIPCLVVVLCMACVCGYMVKKYFGAQTFSVTPDGQ